MFQFLSHLIAQIPDSSSTTVVTVAGFAEILMRYIPSQKPLSIIHSVAAGCELIAQGLGKVGALLDGVFGQNVAPKA